MQMSNMEKFVVVGMNHVHYICGEIPEFGKFIQKYRKKAHRRYVNQKLNDINTDYDDLSMIVVKRCTDWDII